MFPYASSQASMDAAFGEIKNIWTFCWTDTELTPMLSITIFRLPRPRDRTKTGKDIVLGVALCPHVSECVWTHWLTGL